MTGTPRYPTGVVSVVRPHVLPKKAKKRLREITRLAGGTALRTTSLRVTSVSPSLNPRVHHSLPSSLMSSFAPSPGVTRGTGNTNHGSITCHSGTLTGTGTVTGTMPTAGMSTMLTTNGNPDASTNIEGGCTMPSGASAVSTGAGTAI